MGRHVPRKGDPSAHEVIGLRGQSGIIRGCEEKRGNSELIQRDKPAHLQELTLLHNEVM